MSVLNRLAWVFLTLELVLLYVGVNIILLFVSSRFSDLEKVVKRIMIVVIININSNSNNNNNCSARGDQMRSVELNGSGSSVFEMRMFFIYE